MSARRSSPAQVSLADQLLPLKDAVARADDVGHDHPASAELVFPTLLCAEDIEVPGDLVLPSAETPSLQLRSNHDHWVEFEKLIELGDYVAAATVVDFLDSDASLKASLNGMYVKAKIVIKRGRIDFAQAQSLATKTAEEAKQAEVQKAADQEAAELQHAARQAVAARQRSPFYWLGRSFASMKQNPTVAGPSFAAAALLAVTGLHRAGF